MSATSIHSGGGAIVQHGFKLSGSLFCPDLVDTRLRDLRIRRSLAAYRLTKRLSAFDGADRRQHRPPGNNGRP